MLKENQRQYIKDFSIDLVDKNQLNTNEFCIYEINGSDIKAVTRLYNFTWIHLWLPFCKAEYCQNISLFQYMAEQHKSDGLAFLMTSETYDIKSINQIVVKSNFSFPVFVLEDVYYGHKMKRARMQISDQLINNDSIGKSLYYSDYVFKDTLLIYAGSNLNNERLDSIINISNSYKR